MPAKNKFLSRLKALYLARAKTGAALTTTLTANAAAGASSLTVAAIVNGSDTDTILVGSGEDAELAQISGAPAGNTINLAKPLLRAHIIGESVREQTVFDHGAPDEGGVDIAFQGESFDVQVASQRLSLATIRGYLGASAEGAFPYFDLSTLVAALGALQTRINGAGTVASPRQFVTDGNEFGEENDVTIIACGYLVDGTEAWVELYGCSMDYTAVRAQLARGNPPRIPFRARASAGASVTTTAPAYVIDVSLRAAKGKVWRALTEVGIRSASGSGVNTTLSAIAAPGALALVVVDSSGAVAGDIIKVGTGSDAEYPIVDSAPDGTHINLRTKLLRAHAAAETVVEQKETKFAAPTDQGVSLEVAGSTRNVRLGHRAFEAGTIPGDAQITASITLGDLLLENFRLALGLPSSDLLSGGTRLFVGDNVGSTEIDALYVKGVLVNGDIAIIDLWGVSQVINEIRTKFSGRDIATIPVMGKPAIIQFLQYQ